jgi:hypothetical protein
MARHEVSLEIPQGITIVNRDIEIDVREDEELLGRVHISRGSIAWRPGSAHQLRHVSWAKFADFMETEGRMRRTSG